MKTFTVFKLIAVIAVILFPGCSEYGSNKLEKEINELRGEIELLKTELRDLRPKVLITELLHNLYKKVELDPSSLKGYQRIDTTSGFFLISLQDVKPYLDGYKIILHIGNPTSGTYSGFKLRAKWGRRFDSSEFKSDIAAYEKWEKSLKEKEMSYTEELRPGWWNKVEMIISPAKPEGIGYLEVSMETNIIKLFGGTK